MNAPSATRVAIVTTGRFHVLDLARELHALGYEVAFYSYVPRRRAAHFGLPRRSYKTLLPFSVPLLALERHGPQPWRMKLEEFNGARLDRAVGARLSAVDVFIGMSGICVESARAARSLGALVFIERGSRHILSQIEILEKVNASRRSLPSRNIVGRELWAYEFADVITVPSRHAQQSFRERGIPDSKLFRNPYGVDLEMFRPTQKPQGEKPTIIFVGSWSLRKGADLLWHACRVSGDWQLLHVGEIGDLPLPQSERFTHVDAVSQEQLSEYYAQADVAVLPSREDGFGVVLGQALACGLPIVASDMTGGADLQELTGAGEHIQLFRSGDAATLSEAIERALKFAAQQNGVRDLLGVGREKLSWRAYGERYAAEIERGRRDQ